MRCSIFVTTSTYSDTFAFTVVVGELRASDPIPDGPRQPPLYWAYDDTDTTYAEHPEFAWVEVSGVGTLLSLSDDQTVRVDLPSGFIWRYYGQDFTQISVCGNGWVAPGSHTLSTYTNTELPNTSMPGLVAVSWDDLYPPTGGGVWYYHDAANHRFVVEYDSVHYYAPRECCDKFELIIYDTTVTTPSGDNMLVTQYLTANEYVSSTVGIQDPSKTIAIQCLFNSTPHRGTAPLEQGRAIKFAAVDPQTGLSEQEPTRLHRSRHADIRVYPNPFTDATMLSVELAQPGIVDIHIYDNTGRLVCTLAENRPVTGRTRVAWNGCDQQNRTLGAGIYFCRLSADGTESWEKVILSR